MDEYTAFLAGKRRSFIASGINVDAADLNPMLFDFQRDIVRWALAKGRACLFLSTGLGKTFQELEWGRQVVKHTGGKVLILAPLAVAAQTVREGAKFGIPVTLCRENTDIRPGINITNYELIDKFDAAQFVGVVLDESSILKSFTSKTRNQIIEKFKNTKFKLACTATPAPNDHMELGNHSEFVGVMSRTEMLSMFFVHDGGETSKWRLKGHAQDVFWKWVASWAIMLSKPTDLGYTASGYDLPPLSVTQHTVDDAESSTRLAEIKAAKKANRHTAHHSRVGLDEQRQLRQLSIASRCKAAAEVVALKPDTQWVVWCDLNDESAALTELIPGAVEVKGSDKPEYKEKCFLDFVAGRLRVMVTKPSICGFGLNFQNCSNTIFVGLSYSFEAYYQAVRRFWRFGQMRPVFAHVVTSSAEGQVVSVIKEKEEKFAAMLKGMIASTQEIQKQDIAATVADSAQYTTREEAGSRFLLQNGDCCELIKALPDESVGFSIFSPPFASLYTYSNSERDMGNSSSKAEFTKHFTFLVTELLRVIKSGRNVAVHCMQLPASKEKDGYIGLKDFRGDIIRIFQEAGFIYHSEVCIWKNPVTQMQRTKALGLLHKQVRKDSAMSRQGLSDYLVVFRKPGINSEPIAHTHETFPVSAWQQFASPVWADINPSATLQYRAARNDNDERHICPLQLPVIERAIALWSNPDDLVLSPFAGIGSEGWQAIKMGRMFVGFELKPSYFDVAVSNLKGAEAESSDTKIECPQFNVFAGRETYGRRVEAPVNEEKEEEEEDTELEQPELLTEGSAS